MSLRQHLAADIAPRTAQMYTEGIKSRFMAENGHEPGTRAEFRRAMKHSDLYQFFSAMQRASQEIMFDSCIDPLERELPNLKRIAKAYAQAQRHGGTLRLNPDLEMPRYLTSHDIHLQPGSYTIEYGEDDVAAGVLWDRSTYLYSTGYLGPKGDLWGRSLVEYCKQRFPELKPRRILDMGCTAGSSAIACKEAFPDAEVHGIDVGAAGLRYAHARAESLGLCIHFSQQNAEHTDFEAGSFDLITGGLLMHETSNSAVHEIFKECHRLLAETGVMAHMDPPQFREMPPLQAFLAAWEAYNANEFFAGTYRDMDLVAAAVAAGFGEPDSIMAAVPLLEMPKFQNYNTSYAQWPAIVAVKR